MINYNSICKNIFLPLIDIANRTTIKRKLEFLNKSQFWSKKTLEEYQNEKLRKLIMHAYKNVLYYKELFDKLHIKPIDIKTKKELKKLPILTKELIRKNFNKLVAKNPSKMTLYATSGSTGEPMSFYIDKEADSWKWACELLGWQWAGYNLGDKHALLSGNPKRGKKKIKDILMRCLYLSTNKIDNNILKNYLNSIIKQKIKFVAGYASAIYLLAQTAKKNKINYKLNGIVTLGETLFPVHRKLIENTFDCNVNDTYGLGGEGLIIADQCEKGMYHVHMENVIVENIENECIVTGLNNYAMPLIRYKTGDLIKNSLKKCSCRRNLDCIEEIKGRTSDIIKTPNSLLILQFFVVLFENIDSVKQFQIMQDKIDSITLNLVVTSKFGRIEEEKIRKSIFKACRQDINIIINKVNSIPRTKTGKNKFIISNIK